MAALVTFIVSVLANIASHLICKWWDSNRSK